MGLLMNVGACHDPGALCNYDWVLGANLVVTLMILASDCRKRWVVVQVPDIHLDKGFQKLIQR